MNFHDPAALKRHVSIIETITQNIKFLQSDQMSRNQGFCDAFVGLSSVKFPYCLFVWNTKTSSSPTLTVYAACFKRAKIWLWVL